MANKVKIINEQGVQVFPITHVSAVLDNNGNNVGNLVESKQATLVSGVNIKTVNGTSLLGGGNVSVGTYSKPQNGIPSTDLASSVQTSLSKADEAAPQSNTYTKSEVNTLITGIENSVILGELPEAGIQNKIYRVPGINSYVDWAWNGNEFIKLAEFIGDLFVQMSEATYEALSDAEKNNGTWYFVEEE